MAYRKNTLLFLACSFFISDAQIHGADQEQLPCGAGFTRLSSGAIFPKDLSERFSTTDWLEPRGLIYKKELNFLEKIALVLQLKTPNSFIESKCLSSYRELSVRVGSDSTDQYSKGITMKPREGYYDAMLRDCYTWEVSAIIALNTNIQQRKSPQNCYQLVNDIVHCLRPGRITCTEAGRAEIQMFDEPPVVDRIVKLVADKSAQAVSDAAAQTEE